ncbi:hypothetical protein H6F67_12500 [Microcoleus sp. FACHB-1515]|uniref:hypothetical protein n=1 Tax=Cyanophyceae TaxID=3028117 RepID=UPI0016842D62|nr:hypothetical protein [Microcoleus sp. FACHB-1515]MBD2090674.1 hypothetical protein [Microcoleus sp. FACHB-1515]
MMRYPTTRQWELFKIYESCPPPIHPSVFCQHWAVSYAELSVLAKTSRSTVEHWFGSGRSHREPAERCCRRLAEIHLIWMSSDRIEPNLIQGWCRLNHSL